MRCLFRLTVFLLRPTKWRLAAWAVAGLTIYLLFLTPEKRAVRHRLGEADEKSSTAYRERVKPLTELLGKGRKGAKAFAKESLSWSGKWAVVKGMFVNDAHRQFLAEAFARHIFSPDELKDVLHAVCRNYADDLDGVESEMLVKLRADVADPDRTPLTIAPHLRSNEAFVAEYRRLSVRLVRDMENDLAKTAANEVVVLVATEIGTRAALQAARAAATELGIKATVLGSGAGSMIATLGLGLVVSLIVDAVLDELFKLVGYDAEAQIEAAVVESINRLQDALLADPGPERHLGIGKKGALRVELEKIHESRSKLRREAVQLMLKEGEAK